MKRFKETKTKKIQGRGDVYKISLPDSFGSSPSILTTYVSQVGERYDNIAYKFYKDSNLWYVIARANKDVTGTLYPPPNKVLIIPRID
jgi:nucleoid-associated protein YgaU